MEPVVSGRVGQLSRVQQLDVGAIVLGERERGICWKRLEERFQCSRRQLWRYVRQYLRTQDVTTNPKMSHLAG